MILDRHPPTHIALHHHEVLAWPATQHRLAAYDLRLFVCPCVAIGYRHLGPSYSLRLTTFVMRHSYGFLMRFRQPLSVFRALGCRLCCMVAFCGFMVWFLSFPMGHASSVTMQGLHGAAMRYGWGVAIEYHHHVVRHCILGLWLCLCVSFAVAFLRHLFLVLSEWCLLCVAKTTSYL